MSEHERRHLQVRLEVQLETVDLAEARLLVEVEDYPSPAQVRRVEELRRDSLEAADELERIRASLLEVDLAMQARS